MGEIALRELQSVLQKHLASELVVDQFETSSLVPLGENYGSSIFKVRALVRDNESAESRELHLVAKMLPPTQFQRDMFKCSFTVKKEIYFYDQVYPSYQNLERECGIEEKDVQDVVPKFYGGRASLVPEIDAEVDEDAVIILENLREAGYYILDRKKGILEFVRN